MSSALPASIPSPTSSILWLGPLPIRAYALCILAGIAVAIWLCGRRLAARGYPAEKALDVAYWGVPFGILGGRIYHVITTPQPYFGEGGRPLDAFKIWQGGLGIWGAIALGAVGVWIGCRRAGISFLDYADAAVPGVAIAQAMGRVGNYFNNELYGEPTTVPWALQIHRMGPDGQALRDAAGQPIVEGYFHPTFLYEAIWCLVMAAIILLLDRRGALRRGQSLALYVLLYPVGRIVFELMRTDPANRILGLRVNVWTSIVVFLLGVTLFWLWRRNPARPRAAEETSTDEASTVDEASADEASTADEPADDVHPPDGPGPDPRR